jgi:hypothetical protein
MTDDAEHPDWFDAADAGPEPTVPTGDYDSEYDWFDRLEPGPTPTEAASDAAPCRTRCTRTWCR